MGQTKGIAIRIDNELLKEIENHNLGRNDLVIQAIESYLHESDSKTKSSSKKKEKTSSTWSEIEENSEKIKNISKKTPQPETTQPQKTTIESLTDDFYNEVYSIIYNTEVTPLKKQLELKDDLIHTLQQQNKSIQADKQFLFDHIKNLEERIPKKQRLFQKRKK
ncbi:MAG: hypothetical protein KGY67_08825 [Candidatus Thermoplasmatota archaeon]|nr:hypothetical protein [Candidatus Thermoplasmatota archaeon]